MHKERERLKAANQELLPAPPSPQGVNPEYV
jgi:hypothetical protein